RAQVANRFLLSFSYSLRCLFLAPQVAIVIHDPAVAVVVVKACIAPAAISFLTGCFKPIAVSASITASELVVAGRQSSLPSASVVASALGAAKVSIVIDNLAATIAVVEGGGAPVAIPFLTARLHGVTIRGDIPARQLVVAARHAAKLIRRTGKAGG